jgi:MFS family permease
VFAIMMTSLCWSYWQLMLAQGVLTGLSQGFLIFPAMAAVAQYFDKKRGAAIGLVIAGASVGAVVFPIALSRLLDDPNLGFGWTMRIFGFIVLPVLVFSALTVRARLPPRVKTLFVWSAFRNAKFLLLVAAFFFVFLGMFTPLFFLPSYGLSIGIGQSLSFYLVAIINGASFFGRVIPGMLADKYGRLNVLAVAAVCTGIITLTWTAATTAGGLVAYSVVFGFFSGAIVSGGSVVFAITADSPTDIGTYMGMGMPLASFAQLIGPPINGVFLAGTDGFFHASIFSGIMCLVGGILVILVKTRTAQGLFGQV